MMVAIITAGDGQGQSEAAKKRFCTGPVGAILERNWWAV